MKKVKYAGRALKANLNNASGSKRIPLRRLEELENTLKEHFSVEVLTEELLEVAASTRYTEENADYVPPSQAVVQHYLETGGVAELEEEWRQHFMDTMQPKHYLHIKNKL